MHCGLEHETALITYSGLTKQNKMAAELSTLVSSFLDTKPETYAPFFLDCVNAKQHLNTEVSMWAGILPQDSFRKGFLVFCVPRAIHVTPPFAPYLGTVVLF